MAEIFILKNNQKRGINNEKNIRYSLDILKPYFNPSLKIQEAVEEFVSENIKENAEEKKLFERMFPDYER